MKLSTRSRYGLRAIIDLARNSSGSCVSLADISKRQDLSQNYLESIFAILKRGGLVMGMAGAQGGYVLARPANEITIYDILIKLEGNLSVYDRIGEETRLRSYLNRNVWDVIDLNVCDTLKNTTLEQVIKAYDSSIIDSELPIL